MLQFFKQEVRWRSLTYKNKLNEKDYQLERENYQRWTFRVFYTLLSIIVFYLWVSGFGIVSPYTPFRISVNIFKLFSVVIVHIIIKCYPRWIEEIIIILISISVCFYVELNKDSPRSGAIDIFLFGLLLQTLCVFLILIRIRFPRLLTLLLLTNIYSTFRMFYKENFEWPSIQALIIGLSNVIFLSAFAYGKELYERKLHHEIKKYEQSLSLYESLIKDIIPLSIIIYDDSKIYFTNKETQRIMKIRNEEDIKEKLQKIQVKNVKNLDTDSFDKFFSSHKSESSIFDNFYSLMKRIIPKNQNITCIISPGEEEVESDKLLNIKIKISRIFWNDRMVKIMLISEDHSAKEIVLLQQREAFKDKFLATISHELRTPLNGIIGMILVAKDSCKNDSLKNR